MDSLFGTIRLGTLIDQLRLLPAEHDVEFEFAGFSPGNFDSYRGFYDHLAITPIKTRVTTGFFLKELQEKALNKKFEGYKGGTYTMTYDTPVWVSHHGEANSTGIIAVRRGSYVNWIETKHIEV